MATATRRYARDARTFLPCKGGCGALDDGTVPVKAAGRDSWYCVPCFEEAWAQRFMARTATLIRKLHKAALVHKPELCTICSGKDEAAEGLRVAADAVLPHNRRW